MLFDKVELKKFTPIRKKSSLRSEKKFTLFRKNSCTVQKTVQFVQKKVLKNKFSSFSKKVHFVRKKGSCSVQKKSLAKKFTSFRKKFQKKVHFAQKKSSREFRQNLV